MRKFAENKAVLRNLSQFVRYPSVSAKTEYFTALRSCDAWIASHLRAVGFDHAISLPMEGPPVVFADNRRAPGKPAILIYRHYDVQPADGIETSKRFLLETAKTRRRYEAPA